MAESAEEVASHLKKYLMIGGLLFAFTVITVLVAFFTDLGEPGIDFADLGVGLAIAAFKASLVALIFMHLNHEKSLIYKILVFTFVFVLGLFVLTYLAWIDPIVFPGVFK